MGAKPNVIEFAHEYLCFADHEGLVVPSPCFAENSEDFNEEIWWDTYCE